jgi:hypothetical protein
MKLKATLPKGDLDGLSPSELAVDRHPDEPILVVMHLEASTRTEELATGLRQVSLSIRHIEVALGADALEVNGILDRRYRARTGKETLPFDFDPDTGEVHDEPQDGDQ